MSLALAAQNIQSQGRGNDTHLVHMTTGELQALQKIAEHHGGSLTINPKTGLPEAGFLSAVLPTVAGIGLGALTGDPLLAAGIVGVADTAITGSLGQGLMAGFGAWGGANFYNNIADFGANPNNMFTAQETLATSTPEIDATTGAAVNTGSAEAALGPDASYNMAPNYNIDPNTKIQTGLNPQVVAPATTNASGVVQAGGYTGPNFGQGLKNAFAHPMDYLSKPGNALNAATTLGPPLLAGYQALNQQDPYTPPAKDTNPMHLKVNSPNFQAMLPEQPTPYQPVYRNYVTNPYNPYTAKNGGLMDVHKYASAGLADLEDMPKVSKKDLLEAEQKAIADINKGAAMFKRPVKEIPVEESTIYVDRDPNTANLNAEQAAAHRASAVAVLAQMPSSYFAGMQKFPSLGTISTDPVVASKYAHGGLPDYHLGDYSDGGRLLKGPGDGVSDSIPATIGHKQPARLAEGEFVIPARIVSELGNGSTDAGAKRLYAMMDRIKAKRAKAKDIAADTKAYKELPV